MDTTKIGIGMIIVAIILLGISWYQQTTGSIPWLPQPTPTPPPSPTPTPTPSPTPTLPTPTPTPGQGKLVYSKTEFSASNGELIQPAPTPFSSETGR